MKRAATPAGCWPKDRARGRAHSTECSTATDSPRLLLQIAVGSDVLAALQRLHPTMYLASQLLLPLPATSFPVHHVNCLEPSRALYQLECQIITCAQYQACLYPVAHTQHNLEHQHKPAVSCYTCLACCCSQTSHMAWQPSGQAGTPGPYPNACCILLHSDHTHVAWQMCSTLCRGVMFVCKRACMNYAGVKVIYI